MVNYKNNKYYKCHITENHKCATWRNLKEPKTEGTLIKGEDKKILGLNCQKYMTTVNHKKVEVFTTKQFGLRHVKGFNIPGLLLEYKDYKDGLGFYTVKAIKISNAKLPQKIYSLKGHKLFSGEKSDEHNEKCKADFNKVIDKMIGSKSPYIKAKTINKEKFSSKKMLKENKVLVYNFSYTACTSCIDELPRLNALKKHYKNNEDVKFIAVVDDNKKNIKSFLKRQTIDYDFIIDEKKAKSIAEKLKVHLWPSDIIIDKQGRIQFYNYGYKSTITEIMAEKIDELLEE